MPQPRKASPRRRDSRRSRSFSPRPSHSRRRSHSRSPKDRRHSRSRSRSPVRKRSPLQRRQRSPKHYSPPRQRSRSPQRKRSRTPQRKRSRTPQRKRSRTPQRKGSRSPQRKRSQSPVDRSYPVKRQADSSGKRQSYRSRSPSPAPVKRSKDGRFYQEESPDEWRYSSSYKQHSPSPRQRSSSPYGGKMYADQSPSCSKRPLFPAAEKKRRGEIESVKIVDKVRKEKLDKRFQTLEQLAQGHFEFEENITIGIHRGPSHMELDEDVPVDYDINLKTFVMIFPKKDYLKAIFDRDEIKAFHHDDILDEEAYVEKRTITVKPTDKQKQKWSDETEYKITIGGDQCGYGDRRRVQDSGSRSRGTRSSHGESDVKVRLDPKPDPRYEKLYREHQRQEDESLMQENIQRNPNDLRYNLMRKNSTGDRGNRDRDRGSDRDHGRDSGMVDARSKIEARRQESHSGSRRDSDRKDIPRDGRDSRHSPPPSSIERKKPVHVKTDLPDFKNRPDKFQYKEWEENPEVIPKGSYFEHDSRSRDDMNFWERKQIFLKTGRYPGERGGFRGRGNTRGFGRGFNRGSGFTRGYNRGGFTPRGRGLPRYNPRDGRGGISVFKGRVPFKGAGSSMDEWKHDKFSEIEGEESGSQDDKTSKNDKSGDKKERKSHHHKDKKDKDKKRKDKETRKDIKNEQNDNKERNTNDIRKEEEALENELSVEVTV